jgi:hypothetical protein
MTTEKLPERKAETIYHTHCLQSKGFLLCFSCSRMPHVHVKLPSSLTLAILVSHQGVGFILFYFLGGNGGRKYYLSRGLSMSMIYSTSLTICCALRQLHDGMLPSRMLPMKDSPPREVILQGGVLMSMKKNPRYLGPWDQSLPHLCARYSNS